MAEALSQSQIDELLNRMLTGGSDDEAPVEEEVSEEEKLKKYDFTSPKKFTKDQLNSLTTLYESFSRMFAIYLTSVLRNVCDMEVSQVEEQRYYEYSNIVPDATLVAVFSFEPTDSKEYMESTITMEFPTSIGFLLIERLTGGTGKAYSPERDFSEIELMLIRIIFSNVCKHLQEAWNSLISVEIKHSDIETNGRLIQVFSPQDIVVIASLEISDSDHFGLINICMAAESVDAIIGGLGDKYARSVKYFDPEKERIKKETLMGYLKQSDLEITAVLDDCKMKFQELLSLQPGDIISLGKKIDSDIAISIEGMPWATARIGEMDNMKAIKLVDIVSQNILPESTISENKGGN